MLVLIMSSSFFFSEWFSLVSNDTDFVRPFSRPTSPILLSQMMNLNPR